MTSGTLEHEAAQPVRGTGEQRTQGDDAEQSRRRAAWERALACYRRADSALAAAQKGPEALYDRLGARHHRALARLLTTPAPDVAALARKLDLALYDRAVEFAGDAAAMKALKQDAHRLSRA